MRLLLDTHVLLWWWSDDPRLAGGIRDAIGLAENSVFVSAASAWEMTIKVALGRLDAPVEEFEALAEVSGFDLLPITAADAVAVGTLPPFHRDPFDRMLIAQARTHGLVLVSVDRAIAAYDVSILDG